MVAWDKAKGKPQGNNERREIKRVKLQLGDTRLRLVGDVLPRYCYWITNKEGNKLPVECLQFIRETESFDNTAEDPFKEIDEDVYNEKASFAFVCNVINRATGEVELFDLRSTIYTQIVSYAVNPEYGNPADEAQGYDIVIKKEKTGPLPQNVKYTVIPARSNSPLTDEEKALELYDLDKIFKRQNYEEQKKWLMDNTFLFTSAAGDEFKAEGVDDLA